MKRRLLLPAICVFVSTTAMCGADVYFYHHSTDNPVNRMTNAHKLIFNETSTEVVNANGQNRVVGHDDFDYILFRAKSESSTIDATGAESHLEIAATENAIRVLSSEPIDRVTLTDIAGRTVTTYAPATTQLEIPTRELPTGLLIITATSGKEITTTKTFIK